jgi:hypothetical protein
MVDARRQRYACPIAGIELSSRAEPPARSRVIRPALGRIYLAPPAPRTPSLTSPRRRNPPPRGRDSVAHRPRTAPRPVPPASQQRPATRRRGFCVGWPQWSRSRRKGGGTRQTEPTWKPGFPPFMPLAGSPHPISLQSGEGHQTWLWLGVSSSTRRERRAVGEST